MRQYEYRSRGRRSFEFLRKWTAVVSAFFVACIFWGMSAAWIARVFSDISEDHALLFVAAPTGILVAGYLWSRLPSLVRALGFDEDEAL